MKAAIYILIILLK